MTFHKLQEQALKLSVEERWQLIYALMQSLQPNLQPIAKDRTASSINVAKTEELAQMANDPEIQAEIAAIDAEFAVAEQDGLRDV